MIRNCPYCGKEFIKSLQRRKYCSIDCQIKFRRRLDKVKAGDRKSEKIRRDSLSDSMVKKAIYIGSKGKITYDQITSEMIVEKRASLLVYRKRREELAKIFPSCKVFFKKCKECSQIFTARNRLEDFCSEECRTQKTLRSLRQKYEANWVAPEPFECKECGKMYQIEFGETNTVFCSLRCSNKYAGREHKKRAEQNGVYYEYVNPRIVFERDRWRCQLCGKKLNPKNRGTIKDNAPELDHIIPWAQGGEHSYQNTQCSCRKCNRIKWVTGPGQLRLFG